MITAAEVKYLSVYKVQYIFHCHYSKRQGPLHETSCTNYHNLIF